MAAEQVKADLVGTAEAHAAAAQEERVGALGGSQGNGSPASPAVNGSVQLSDSVLCQRWRKDSRMRRLSKADGNLEGEKPPFFRVPNVRQLEGESPFDNLNGGDGMLCSLKKASVFHQFQLPAKAKIESSATEKQKGDLCLIE
jgi:hypothetical protein